LQKNESDREVIDLSKQKDEEPVIKTREGEAPAEPIARQTSAQQELRPPKKLEQKGDRHARVI
jgi:hypothetical protein